MRQITRVQDAFQDNPRTWQAYALKLWAQDVDGTMVDTLTADFITTQPHVGFICFCLVRSLHADVPSNGTVALDLSVNPGILSLTSHTLLAVIHTDHTHWNVLLIDVNIAGSRLVYNSTWSVPT